MCNNLTESDIVWIMIFGSLAFLYIAGRITESKAKAFAEGYRRGRSTRETLDGPR
jgi:hypothetical protein